jgi:hypothetical protein
MSMALVGVAAAKKWTPRSPRSSRQPEDGLRATGPFELPRAAPASFLDYRRPRSVAFAPAAHRAEAVDHAVRQRDPIAARAVRAGLSAIDAKAAGVIAIVSIGPNMGTAPPVAIAASMCNPLID